MPIKLEYLRDLNILIATVESPATMEMFKQTINEIISSIEYPPDVSTIWDLRKLDFDSIDSNFVKGVIAIRKDIDISRGNVKIAYVVSSDLSFGMTRMYQIFSEIEGLAQSIQIFRNLDDAKKWLLQDR
ncbi:hypothetical protein [Desulforhopalus sp. 52FAK]